MKRFYGVIPVVSSLTTRVAVQSVLWISLLFLALFAGTGCVSRKPLPYEHSAAIAPSADAPSLVVRQAIDERPKLEKGQNDQMPRVLKIPECLNPVVVTELERSGYFSSVCLTTNESTTGRYVLETRLKRLQWEVPHYDRLVQNAFWVSFFGGVIGGTIYGSTGTDVLGHANVRFVLSDCESNKTLLDREYEADAKERKKKFSCDTPDTYREMAAKAFKNAFEQFKHDLNELHLGKTEMPLAAKEQ